MRSLPTARGRCPTIHTCRHRRITLTALSPASTAEAKKFGPPSNKSGTTKKPRDRYTRRRPGAEVAEIALPMQRQFNANKCHAARLPRDHFPVLPVSTRHNVWLSDSEDRRFSCTQPRQEGWSFVSVCRSPAYSQGDQMGGREAEARRKKSSLAKV